MSNTCLFCKNYKNKTGIIFENDHFYAQFDKFPVAPGHALIIPKKHIVSLLDLSESEWAVLLPALREVKKIIESSIDKKPDGYNFGNNDGEAAGRTIHHLHIHVIPRFFGDVEDVVGGIRHIIPGVGNYR